MWWQTRAGLPAVSLGDGVVAQNLRPKFRNRAVEIVRRRTDMVSSYSSWTGGAVAQVARAMSTTCRWWVR
jgi:hypothetical protein